MDEGLLQAPKAPQDDMLKRVAAKAEQTVKPEDRQVYDAIIVAGMKLMWGSYQTHKTMVEYMQMAKQNPSDTAKIVSHGIIKMLSIILKESKLPVDRFMAPSAPAAIVLMTQALDYMKKRLGVPIDTAVIDQCSKAVAQGLFELYDVTPEQIDEAVAQRQPGASPEQPTAPEPGGM